MFRRLLASMGVIVTKLGAPWFATDAGTAKTAGSKTHANGYLPLHLQRRQLRSTRRVEREVIDHWLLWRR